jgi:hypothetical protein
MISDTFDDTFDVFNYCRDCGSEWIDCVCTSETWTSKKIKEHLASGDEEYKTAYMEEVKIDALRKEIDRVSKYEWIKYEGWDYPSLKTITRAKDLADEIVKHIKDQPTHPLNSPDGHIVFEWWNGNDKLTLYVTETAFIAIRSSNEEISEIEYSSVSDCVNHEFSWITNFQI